jgi:hypothetical protein
MRWAITTVFLIPTVCFGAGDYLTVNAGRAGMTPAFQFHFNENSGTVARDSGGKNSATLTAASWAQGKFGYGLAFNAAGALASVQNKSRQPTGNQPWVFSTWIRFTDGPAPVNDGKFFAFGTFNTNARAQLGTDENGVPGTIRFKTNYFDTADTFANIKFSRRKWNFFIFQWTGSNQIATIIIDGITTTQTIAHGALNLGTVDDTVIGNTQTAEGDQLCLCTMDDPQLLVGTDVSKIKNSYWRGIRGGK